MPNFNEILSNLRAGGGQQAPAQNELRPAQPIQQTQEPAQRLQNLRLGGVDQNQLNLQQGFQSNLDMIQADMDKERTNLKAHLSLPISRTF